jgi:Tfp pilus assembly protein FimT
MSHSSPQLRVKAFTLIELTVVIAVIIIISALVYTNYQGISDRGDILATVSKVQGHIRQSQAYAVTGKPNNDNLPYGWGVHFDRSRNRYTIFSDINDNKTYDYPVKLLIHGSETGSPFTESSASSSKSVTITGATRSTTGGKPSGDGYWSFDGGDYLSLAHSADFDFATSTFTIDAWIKPGSTGSLKHILSLSEGANHSWYLSKDANNYLSFYFKDSLSNQWTVATTSGSTIINDTNTWYHVAVSRSGAYLRTYVNGVQSEMAENFYATSSVAVYGSSQLYLGSLGSTASWDGYIDEIRITKGSARWTSGFTVPTDLSPADEELYRTYKLMPGVVFDRLYVGGTGGTAVSELNTFWLTSDPLHYTYSNGTISATSSIIINHAGAEGTGNSADTPSTVNVSPGGWVK